VHVHVGRRDHGVNAGADDRERLTGHGCQWSEEGRSGWATVP
jgi:hypothetical protein